MTDMKDAVELVREAREERELKQLRILYGCDDCYGWDPVTCGINCSDSLQSNGSETDGTN